MNGRNVISVSCTKTLQFNLSDVAAPDWTWQFANTNWNGKGTEADQSLVFCRFLQVHRDVHSVLGWENAAGPNFHRNRRNACRWDRSLIAITNIYVILSRNPIMKRIERIKKTYLNFE